MGVGTPLWVQLFVTYSDTGGDRDTVPAGDAAGGSGEASCPPSEATDPGAARGGRRREAKRWVDVPKVPEVPFLQKVKKHRAEPPRMGLSPARRVGPYPAITNPPRVPPGRSVQETWQNEK